MSRALVCSAESEYRSECGVVCEACRFLIGERRSRKDSYFQRDDRERRTLTNLLQFPSVEYAGVPASVFEGEREVSSSWHLIAWLVIFNLLDCIFTARALSMGFIEGNPVMAALFDVSLPLAMLSKTLVVGLGVYILWHYRHLKIAAYGLTALTAVYGLLVLYHISFQLAF
jgi:hypothetical protein